MRTAYRLLLTACCLLPAAYCLAQQGKFEYTLTLEEVIDLAQDQSLDAIRTKNTFLANYWQYVSYKANYLPSLSLSGSLPDFTKQYTAVAGKDSTGAAVTEYLSEFSNRISGTLAIEQNLPTGGRISVYSSLEMYDQYENNLSNRVARSFRSIPVNISYTQSFFGVNNYKWDRKIEPLKYEEAKRSYLRQMEEVSIRAIRYFFDYAGAVQNLAIAEFNYANNDTLYKIARGRYNIGTIGENDLLQSELNFMDASSTLNEAQLTKESTANRLRSFLGFNELATVEITIPTAVPRVLLDLEKVLLWARKNNPDLLAYQRQLLEVEKRVAEETAANGFQANLSVTFGLNQRANTLEDAYKSPNDMENVRITLGIPILDWGRGRGRVRTAKSNQEVVKNQVEQAYVDFEQDVLLKVRQFNMQDTQFHIAAKSDTIAQKRYEVSKQRFLIDKITITDMNNAQMDRDRSQQNYVNALRNYWNFYYTIRQLSLYDYINDKSLDADFDLLVK
ncbi:MAG: TolC family protein [Bacteroidales bacterium]|nr:TolC family protein [Bacteroidales bacterium]MCL2133337.1 TolC family protein [Bacteroidales bacterium]